MSNSDRQGSMALTAANCMALRHVREAVARGFICVDEDRITYKLQQDRCYDWTHPEEWARCATIAWLIIDRDYSPKRIGTEVVVPRRTPSDRADIVLFRDAACKKPFLVVENKPDEQSTTSRRQAIEQAFGNANSLRAPYILYDEWSTSLLFDNSGRYGPLERQDNLLGDRKLLPPHYNSGSITYRYVAGDEENDIRPAISAVLENKIRRTHSLIWSGGRRDPLNAFDEWSKLLFAKVYDERTTPNGKPRSFQVGSEETDTAVANRVHQLFVEAAEHDQTVFPPGIRIDLPDDKVRDVVALLQDVSIIDTHTDTIGRAFESFFGSVFRGDLGQYFTMREICRFIVAALDIDHTHIVIDPTAGSGGFLLETLLQGWRQIDAHFAGQREISRKKYDFASSKVYGIEIHAILSRILKINLLLHHDGHTNVEADRSCLDTTFEIARLQTRWRNGFHRVVGNPPFGDTVKLGDRDLLGDNNLHAFTVARGRKKVPSEHLVLERSIDMLRDSGRLGLVLPDGLFNNQGDSSNCPAVRRMLAQTGAIEAIVSLPDHAFRKSGAQNKTSILIYRKYTIPERTRFQAAYRVAKANRSSVDPIAAGLETLGHSTFLAESNHIGYSSTGAAVPQNELYVADGYGFLAEDQVGSILGEFRRYQKDPETYAGSDNPQCMSIKTAQMWTSHHARRLDPKYHLFKHAESRMAPDGWISVPVRKVMAQRLDQVYPQRSPDEAVVVLTITQTGELRPREPGKGKAPPEWLGMYFQDSPSRWFAVREGDVVFSGIDLWKGCIAVVPAEFDSALVTKEFPVYRIIDERLDPDFLSALLRSHYYQRAFRAITTGHSNRRRTQTIDFEALEIAFPPDRSVQRALVAELLDVRLKIHDATQELSEALVDFSNVVVDHEYTEK